MKIDVTGMSRLGFDENENTVLMVENWRRAAVCTSLASLSLAVADEDTAVSAVTERQFTLFYGGV